jgi:hypothetical protein
MTPTDILAAIAASASLQALVPDTQALADALSTGRTQASRLLIGKGDIISLIGFSAGNAALDAVDAAPDFRHVRHLLTEGRMDCSLPMFAGALAGLVAGGALTQADADLLHALGQSPDLVSEFDVRCAIYADDGSLRT